MKSKKNTSPVRSRDKVLQSLYEIELGGSTAEEILEDKIIQKNYPHFKDLLIGVTESISELDVYFKDYGKRLIRIRSH